MKLKYSKDVKIKEHKKPVIDIFIRSYPGDFEWLGYCLKSIKKYCTGFRQIILTVTEDNIEKARNSEFLDLSDVSLMPCKKYLIQDYVGQMITKSMCPNFSDADIFFHIDSDSMFYYPFDLKNILKDNKIRYYYNLYEDVKISPWRSITENIMKQSIEYEFMRKAPMSFYKETYINLQKFFLEKHKKEIDKWIEDRHKNYNKKETAIGHNVFYSEFNALGAYAFYYQNEKYNFIEAWKEEAPIDILKVYWSWGGLTKEIRKQIEQILS